MLKHIYDDVNTIIGIREHRCEEHCKLQFEMHRVIHKWFTLILTPKNNWTMLQRTIYTDGQKERCNHNASVKYRWLI